MTAATPLASPVITPGVSHRTVVVDSALAAEWLDTYQGPNRKINDTKVMQYQSDMENGRWKFDASPIRFSTEGKLLDGQHRLTALANAVPAMALEFLIVNGLAPDSQDVMDQPQVRTTGQNLALKGIGNSNVVAAATKLYLDWTKGRLFKSSARGQTSKPEALQWAMEHQDLFDRVFGADVFKVDAPPSVVAAFALYTIQFAPARTHRFITQLASGVGLVEGNPILALDRRLRNIRRHGQKISQREYLAYFIKAWNAWVSNSQLTKLQLGPLSSDGFPIVLRLRDLGPVE